MREIEIKVRLDDRAEILAKLATKGVKLSKPLTHHDVVYGEPGVAGDSGSNQAAWLRIRTETAEGKKPRVLFTFKRSVSGQMDSIEHETEVADGEVITAIIKELGFEL